MPKTELEPMAPRSEVVLASPHDFAAAAAVLRSGGILRVPEEDDLGLIKRVLDADSLDSVLSTFALDTTNADNISGHALELRGTRLVNSDMERYEGSCGVFAVIEVMDLTDGEIKTVTCGGRMVVAALIRIAELVAEGRLIDAPRFCIVRSEKATRAGWHPLNLVPVAGDGEEAF